jgi:hypothetical protein
MLDSNKELSDAMKAAADLKLEITKKETELKALTDAAKVLHDMILQTLEFMDLDSMRAHGFLFYKENKTSVTTPKTPEEKEQLFQFLRDKGIFLEFASVNSQSLNSLYKSLAEEAAENGVLDFKLPGVGEPTIYTTLKMRKG